MTPPTPDQQLEFALAEASAYMHGVAEVVAAFVVMSAEHKRQLAITFPTLGQAVSRLATAHAKAIP